MKIKYETENREPRYILVESFCHNTLSHQVMYLPEFYDIKANNFTFSNLYLERGAYKNTELINCIFDNAVCYKMLFYQTTFKNCQFINTQFEDCHFMECQFIDCDFTGISKNIDNYFINCNIYDFDNQAYFALQGRNQVHSLDYIDEEYNTQVIHLDYLYTYKYKENYIKVLENCDLSNLYLHRLRILYLNLKNFDFSNSNLRGMGFDYSIVENCNFDNTFFCVVNCYYTIFKSCTFRRARFIGNRLFHCEFIDCDFTDATQPEPKNSEFVDCNIDDFPIFNDENKNL